MRDAADAECYVWWWMHCRFRASQADGGSATARGCGSMGRLDEALEAVL